MDGIIKGIHTLMRGDKIIKIGGTSSLGEVKKMSRI
jgi:hypothetical protein